MAVVEAMYYGFMAVAAFIGAIFGALSCNEVCRKGGEDGSAQD